MSGLIQVELTRVHGQSTVSRICAAARYAAVAGFIATLAWAPFPLGGAITWAPGVQEILIALCWTFWLLSTVGSKDNALSGFRLIAIPLGLAALVLAWGCVQIFAGVPSAWDHPVWSMAAETLHTSVDGVISLNPWRTESEVLKLASSVMAALLAFQLARRADTAKLLLNGIIIIGGAYVLYAFVLEFAGVEQTSLFYSVPWRYKLMSGPFMLHNSFATYAGLVSLAAVVRLFSSGSESIVSHRGLRPLADSVLQYCFGRGALLTVAALLSFAAVVASASRAGFAATMCGLIAMAAATLLMRGGRTSRLWAGAGALVAALPMFVLIVSHGDTLADRIGQLLSSGEADEIRLSLWAATWRMISDSPWFGLGLGTFQDAYPLYATDIYPYVMDKAHCDYLEFAAGLGVPAANAWWTAIVWLFVLCLRGVRVRRRHRIYCMVAIGATVLVAVHSAVDFSLQLPAVALLYATLMGLGVAQCSPTRRQQ
jgi:O-antigen ligase